MIRHLSITGLGPCASLSVDLDPNGVTTITAPSERGKSTLIRASTWALLGVDLDGSALDVRAIDDAKSGDAFEVNRAEVVLTTKSGTVISRSITRSRSQTRKITKGGDERTCQNEEEFARLLGTVAKTLPIGTSSEHAARFILAPFAWEALTAKGGKALRELLSHVVPGDHRADVAKLFAESAPKDSMAQGLFPDDPLDEKGAVEARRVANADRDTAQGAFREAEAAFSGLVEPPAARSTGEAAAVLVAAEAWKQYEADNAQYERDFIARVENAATRAKARADREAAHRAHVERVTAEIASWDARKAAMGPTPAHPIAPPLVTKEREALERVQTRIVLLTSSVVVPSTKVGNLQRDLEAARAKLRDLEAHGETCPTCRRDGWKEAQQALDEASGVVTGIQEALGIAEDEAKAEREAAETKRVNELADAEGEREKLRKKIDAYDTAKAQYDADLSAWKAADAARQALGDRPRLPVAELAPEDEPALVALVEPHMPTTARPNAEEVSAATALIDAEKSADGARLNYAKNKSQATQRVESAKNILNTKQARAAYLDRLVDAIRKAPIERAKRMGEVLGDLGPVSFSVTNDGAEVLFDQRPHWLASRGRRVVCDLWLRAGLRRALGMPWLPIWIDDCSAWTGEWPAVSGPIVYLVTAETSDGGLVVDAPGLKGKEASQGAQVQA